MNDERHDDERYEEALRAAVERALDEDRVDRDVTTLASVPPDARCRGRILFRSAGILAGIDAAGALFRTVDEEVVVEWAVGVGDRLRPGAVIARLEGRTRSILSAERGALNFMMHLSGVATWTARYVEAVRGTGVEILDTRKTLPGLRHLEKRAVAAGGGVNHRVDLASMALLKENHIAAAGSIEAAVRKVRALFPGVAVEVEVENLDELEETLDLDVERVMLDNFNDESIVEAVRRVRSRGGGPYIEVSGGFDLERAAKSASLGMDGISIGALTHSAPAADVSLLIEEAHS